MNEYEIKEEAGALLGAGWTSAERDEIIRAHQDDIPVEDINRIVDVMEQMEEEDNGSERSE